MLKRQPGLDPRGARPAQSLNAQPPANAGNQVNVHTLSHVARGDHLTSIDMIEAAYLAANVARNTGWSVLPVLDTKKPATPHGYKDAASDPKVVARLWRDHHAPL